MFFISYKVNGVLYYGTTVDAMKALGLSEMRVFYDHILSHDSKLAKLLCQCYERYFLFQPGLVWHHMLFSHFF